MPHHYGWDQSFLDLHGSHLTPEWGSFEAHTLPDTQYPWIKPDRIEGYGLRTFTEPWRVAMETREVIIAVAEWGVFGPAYRVVKKGATEVAKLIYRNEAVRNFLWNRVKQPVQSFLTTAGIYAFLMGSGKAATSKTAAKSGRAYVQSGYGTPKPNQTILGNQIKTIAAGYKYDSAKFWADIWENILKALGKDGVKNLAQSLLDSLRDRGEDAMPWYSRRRRTYRRPYYIDRWNNRNGYGRPRRRNYRRSYNGYYPRRRRTYRRYY